MRNARKRRLKRKHGNTPAKKRQYSTIKRRLDPQPIALAPKPKTLSLDDL